MAADYTARDRQITRETHKLFWRATFSRKGWFALWVLTRPAAMLINNVLIPFAVAFGVQAIIARHFDSVGHYALVIFLLGVVYCVLWGVGGVAICINGRDGTEFIQREIFRNYLNKDYEFFNNTFLGSLGAQAARLKDAFNEYNQQVLNSITKQVIIVGASLIIIAFQSIWLALLTLVCMAVVLSFTIATSKWRLKYRRILSETNSEVAGVLVDALGHGTTVKSFAAEDYEQQHLEEPLQKQVHAQYISWMLSVPADLGRIFLASIAIALILLLSSKMYQNGTVSIAIIVLVQIYVIRLVNSTLEIADLVKSYDAVMSSAHQGVKMMLIEPTVNDAAVPVKLPNDQPLTVNLQSVSYKYPDSPDRVLAVRDFDLEIQPGEKVGLVGYSGSGKTTLTKLLLRFMDVTKGNVKIAGIDIRELAQKDLRSHIAYVPQEPLLFHRTIAENIAYGKPSSNRADIEAAGKAAYIDEFSGELKHGYHTLVGERGVKLSGGQRQRVAIARALLKDAPILVLDEATSALDSRSEQFIQKALWKLMEGRTALVIAHRLSTIQRLDRIVVMDKGKIIETGTHDELLKDKKGIYAKLWQHQSGGYLNLGNSTIDTNDTASVE